MAIHLDHLVIAIDPEALAPARARWFDLDSLHRAGLGAQEPVQAHHIGLGLEARIRTPRGVVELRE